MIHVDPRSVGYADKTYLLAQIKCHGDIWFVPMANDVSLIRNVVTRRDSS